MFVALEIGDLIDEEKYEHFYWNLIQNEPKRYVLTIHHDKNYEYTPNFLKLNSPIFIVFQHVSTIENKFNQHTCKCSSYALHNVCLQCSENSERIREKLLYGVTIIFSNSGVYNNLTLSNASGLMVCYRFSIIKSRNYISMISLSSDLPSTRRAIDSCRRCNYCGNKLSFQLYFKYPNFNVLDKYCAGCFNLLVKKTSYDYQKLIPLFPYILNTYLTYDLTEYFMKEMCIYFI